MLQPKRGKEMEATAGRRALSFGTIREKSVRHAANRASPAESHGCLDGIRSPQL
ncbi:MAG: hypothetical protein ACOX0U_08530 [Oscillospiraceae bacterium]